MVKPPAVANQGFTPGTKKRQSFTNMLAFRIVTLCDWWNVQFACKALAHVGLSPTHETPGNVPDITNVPDPVKVMNEAMEESTDWMNTILGTIAGLFAPEEEEEGIRIHKISSACSKCSLSHVILPLGVYFIPNTITNSPPLLLVWFDGVTCTNWHSRSSALVLHDSL